MLQLSSKWAPILVAQPESGMGYQIAKVTLSDGREFDQIVIIGGLITSIGGSSDIPFREDAIATIAVLPQ